MAKKFPNFWPEFVTAHFKANQMNGEHYLRVCDRDFYEKLKKEYNGHDVSPELKALFEKRKKLLNSGDVSKMSGVGYRLLYAMYISLFRYEPDVYDQVGPNAPWERGD